jgi:AcrR family transcriptional regulator
MSTDTNPVTRVPLSRSRVLRAAVGLADRGGIKSLTMRNLAQELGVEAMSLYYHVANKDEILDGVAELVVEDVNEAVGAISGPSAQDDWKTVMRARILTARDVFLRHPWAPGLLESRNAMSPATVRYFNGLLGIFRQGGFSYDLAHHAMHALGSRAMGFAQEMFEPDTEDGGDDAATAILEMADQLPYIVEMMMEVAHDDPHSTLGWCDDQTEFEFGLDLILDGLERLRDKP